MIELFLKDLDKTWKKKEEPPIPLKIIGGAALILQHEYRRVTKDTDVLEIKEFTEEVKKKLVKMAGKNSVLCKRHRVFIDIIAGAFPLLPPKPNFKKLTGIELNNFSVEVLDVTDVVVSKIARFAPTDIDDIAVMIEKGIIDPLKLEKRFLEAIELWQYDARAEKLPKILANYYVIQRDLLLVPESKIELPSWIG